MTAPPPSDLFDQASKGSFQTRVYFLYIQEFVFLLVLLVSQACEHYLVLHRRARVLHQDVCFEGHRYAFRAGTRDMLFVSAEMRQVKEITDFSPSILHCYLDFDSSFLNILF